MKFFYTVLSILPLMAAEAAPTAEMELEPRRYKIGPAAATIKVSALKCRTCAGKSCTAVRQYEKGQVRTVKCEDGYVFHSQ